MNIVSVTNASMFGTNTQKTDCQRAGTILSPATLFEYLVFRLSTDVGSFKPIETDIKESF
jgi:hypothetical protein